MSDYSTIRVQEAAPGVVLVTLNRPEAANALSTAMGRDLLDLWTRLAADPSVRAAVLTGEGRFFCAGADLKERDGMTDEAWAAQHRLFEDHMCPLGKQAFVRLVLQALDERVRRVDFQRVFHGGHLLAGLP